ncbi:nucleotidyl transferase AbiEii/AbiGii toxin family protein [Arachidicoccus terrestris]|uniref:nucleotidyl transferase AbiEii/AbiGii toxin family protein n=1 Tax=Arachidicoccus terrestris TaxID=2875539 RepID=UPI001CC4A719|nr:nucleotidyl transferase AbiEii/AbiGii toxin family protein [Arachidicoccus terrestris]UAY55719.1 nucleotidyl transferase AbiEii/AbiGii toxin family protein [Arachidicoccus terrestris]
MDIELVNRIKRITIIALASDDELMEILVLKGGNAIDLAYQPDSDIVSRTSYDLDYSIFDGDFAEEQQAISDRIEATLRQTFLENNFVVFDYKFLNKPKKISEELIDFWGGYKVEFKVIDKDSYDKNVGNKDKIRRASVPLNPNHSPVFELEFSKFEHVGKKSKIDVDGYKIYVYTPEMIAFEKLRAICQQLPDYRSVIPSFSPRARARDFYDIHLILDLFPINPNTDENKELIANIFEAKKVPLAFIKKIRNNKALHQDNWNSVKDTISQMEKLEDFDFYFNFVLNVFEAVTFP